MLQNRWIRTGIFVLADAVSFLLALLLSFWIVQPSEPRVAWGWFVGFCSLFGVLLFYLERMYSFVYSTVGLAEAVRIVNVFAVYACVTIAAAKLFFGIDWRFVFLADIFLFAMVGMTRFAKRIVRTYYHRFFRRESIQERVMIIGGGAAGSMLIREMQTAKELSVLPVCILDQDPLKKGKFVGGVPVVGTLEDLHEMAQKYKVTRIVVAIPSLDAKRMGEVCRLCATVSGCKVQTLPGIYQLLNEEVSVSKLRDIDPADLLGRPPVVTDLERVSAYIRGKVVLVTGGGGSIGSELCRQIAHQGPKTLLIFDIYENNAYEIQQELRREYPELHLVTLIGSVRDEKKIDDLFAAYRPEIVFNAAAHKHVPLMEDSPCEAVKNNVFGTIHVAWAAHRCGCRKFVQISTDKAVNPTNIMGATKRICEMVIQTFSRHSQTEFVAVRFGNVLGSNGSVIPLFRRQIEEGGPVTVTHKDIIRYFMTIEEAVSLVLQAGAYARGGEIFVLDMGEPVRIYDMAVNLIRLSGYEPGRDIDIVCTGLRPGEKLYEERLMEEEGLQKTENALISIGKPLEFDENDFKEKLERIRAAMEREDPAIRDLVAELVTTYHVDHSHDGAL